MSFINWLLGKPSLSRSAQATQKPIPHPSGEKPPVSVAKPDNVPHESSFSAMRHARRELLFRAIRDAMTQAGVLSFRYKFKVLSQDRRGNSFVVLVDLTHVNGDGMASISEIEALIVQSAARRHDIAVSAVYWRCNELQALSRFAQTSGGTMAIARPLAVPSPAPVASVHLAGKKPIHADEITAFQRALLGASALGSAANAQGAIHAHAVASLFTDFEDTQTSEEAASFPALSSTQYGELR